MFRFVRVYLCALFMLVLAQTVSAVTYTVTKAADTNDGVCDADCSLREAVATANGTTDNDIITFSLPLFNTPQTITLSGTEIVIANNGSLTINGTGADKLTISGNNASRILVTSANAILFINSIRFTAGNGVGATNTGRGGAIYNFGGITAITNSILTGNTAANGGALNNAASGAVPGILSISNTVISNNSATGAGGAVQNFSTSTMNLANVTVSGNTCASTLTGGGGIQANGTLTMTNVTFSGNTANGGDGGGIYYNGSGLTLTNSTITNNTADLGGGLFKSTSTNNANIRNTIIAGNTGGASPDATNVFNSLGNNLIGNVGTSTGWVMSDLQNQAALLTPLGNYGGIGMTHALLSGSPAINAGQNCVVDLTCSANNPPSAVTTDARGATRPANTTVDIGAFELSSTYVAILPSGNVNQPYNQVITPNNGAFTYVVTSGNLPAGLGVAGAFVDPKGEFAPEAIVVISGTPTQAGTSDFAITVSNGMNSNVTNYRINISSLGTVPVSGRVFAAGVNGAPHVRVTITGTSGSRSVLTSSLGYYRFDDVATGQTYTISVSSKQFQYSSLMLIVTDVANDINFFPQM